MDEKVSSFSKKRCHGTYDTTTALNIGNVNLVLVSTIGGIAQDGIKFYKSDAWDKDANVKTFTYCKIKTTGTSKKPLFLSYRISVPDCSSLVWLLVSAFPGASGSSFSDTRNSNSLDVLRKMSPLGHIVERCGESCCYYYMCDKQKIQYEK